MTKDEKHKNDRTFFNVPKVVIIETNTGELYLIDKVSYGFGAGSNGFPIDRIKVKQAGFEILGDL